MAMEPSEVGPDVEPRTRNERADGLDPDRLIAELAAARKRIDDLARAYQEGERDREAFKQRVQRERERLMEVERGQIALSLIEAVDELERCLSVPDGSTDPQAGSLYEGVRLIRDGLVKKLEGLGIERVALVGQTFDPQLAEAVDMEVTPDPSADQRILADVRAAYRAKGRVIRPGRVKVARYLKPADA